MIKAIVFSKNRPMQVEATIRSFEHYCENRGEVEINVLWKGDEEYLENYRELKKIVGDRWIQENGFKSTLMAMLKGEQVLFLVDDMIFLRPFRLLKLDDTQVLGQSLRLGTNVVESYMMRMKNTIPKSLNKKNEDVWEYEWSNAGGDWGYAFEVSASMYRVEDLLWLGKRDWNGPNQLEAALDSSKRDFATKRGKMWLGEWSSAMSVPMNLVQKIYPRNRVVKEGYSPEELNGMWKEKRISWEKLENYIPVSVHEEVEIEFQDR